MNKLYLLQSLVIAAFISVVFAAPADAQATRTWVSFNGDDSNPCTPTAPCRTFMGALSKTAARGEISCLTPGSYGGVTIQKSITIACAPGMGSVTAAAGGAAVGITVNVGPNDVVRLRGLHILAATGASAGISFVGAGVLHLEQTVISGFNTGRAFGISFTPNGASELNVQDTVVSDNGIAGTSPAGGGILVAPVTAGTANVMLSRVTANNNVVGLSVNATNGAVHVSVQDSAFSGNSFNGVSLVTNPGGPPIGTIIIDRSSISSNGGDALSANGAFTQIFVARSTIAYNVGWSCRALNSASVNSFGDNNILFNSPNSGPCVPYRHQ